jgi:hypothetical protein
MFIRGNLRSTFALLSYPGFDMPYRTTSACRSGDSIRHPAWPNRSSNGTPDTFIKPDHRAQSRSNQYMSGHQRYSRQGGLGERITVQPGWDGGWCLRRKPRHGIARKF